MDIVMELVKAALTVGVVAVVIGLIAYLFPLVFSIGTAMDRRMHE